MNKPRILIVEDEILIATYIEEYLEKSNYKVIDIAISYEEAIATLKYKPVDLVLVDINLSGEKTGIDLGNFLNKSLNIPFIYLTSYNDEATLEKLKKTKPIGYQQKPINETNLITALDLFFQNYQNELITLKSGHKEIKLLKKEILYVQASHVYSEVITKNEKVIIRGTLKTFLETIPKNLFVRINRNIAINPTNIKERTKTTILLTNGEEFHITKTYQKNLI